MQEIQETPLRSLGREDPLEKEMATHSSILAWRIPWAEEHDGLQSMGSQRVRDEEQIHIKPSVLKALSHLISSHSGYGKI